MRSISFSSTGGASGDMILAALVDLGADPDIIRSHLESLPIEKFNIETCTTVRHGQRGRMLTVHVDDVEHPHRRLDDIRALIHNSQLDQSVKDLSIEVFQRLAEAEGAVHGKAPEDIHFHEVGAMDSIIDTVGSCLALHLLNVDAVRVGPLPIGSGSLECAHGVMPLPVPATANLLTGHRVTQTGLASELVTPTGAALLMTWQRLLCPPLDAETAETVMGTGTGFGSRELPDRPNMLRAILTESCPEDICRQPNTPRDCLVLECEIDDTVPELIGSLVEKITCAGSLDVYTTPIQMKKQRPGTLLTVLCRHTDRERFVEMIFRESTTFGIRERTTDRTVLDRRHESAITDYGPVRIKIGSFMGEDITRAPEHADCVLRATEHGVSIRRVYEAALRA